MKFYFNWVIFRLVARTVIVSGTNGFWSPQKNPVLSCFLLGMFFSSCETADRFAGSNRSQFHNNFNQLDIKMSGKQIRRRGISDLETHILTSDLKQLGNPRGNPKERTGFIKGQLCYLFHHHFSREEVAGWVIFFGWVKPCTSITLGSVSMPGKVFLWGGCSYFWVP